MGQSCEAFAGVLGADRVSQNTAYIVRTRRVSPSCAIVHDASNAPAVQSLEYRLRTHGAVVCPSLVEGNRDSILERSRKTLHADDLIVSCQSAESHLQRWSRKRRKAIGYDR